MSGQPLTHVQYDTVQAVHRACAAITRLLADPNNRPPSLRGVEYLELQRRRIRNIAEEMDTALQTGEYGR